MSDRHPIRGRVYLMSRLPSGKAVWAYEARVGNNVYLMDDTCDHARMMADCITAVTALRRIYAAGHRLTYTYPELVERAKIWHVAGCWRCEHRADQRARRRRP